MVHQQPHHRRVGLGQAEARLPHRLGHVVAGAQVAIEGRHQIVAQQVGEIVLHPQRHGHAVADQGAGQRRALAGAQQRQAQAAPRGCAHEVAPQQRLKLAIVVFEGQHDILAHTAVGLLHRDQTAMAGEVQQARPAGARGAQFRGGRRNAACRQRSGAARQRPAQRGQLALNIEGEGRRRRIGIEQRVAADHQQARRGAGVAQPRRARLEAQQGIVARQEPPRRRRRVLPGDVRRCIIAFEQQQAIIAGVEHAPEGIAARCGEEPIPGAIGVALASWAGRQARRSSWAMRRAASRPAACAARPPASPGSDLQHRLSEREPACSTSRRRGTTDALLDFGLAHTARR